MGKTTMRNYGNVYAMASEFYPPFALIVSGVWITNSLGSHPSVSLTSWDQPLSPSTNTSFLYELCPLALGHNGSKQLKCLQRL